MANGVSRIVLAQNALKKADLNKAFKNANEVAKATKKMPLKSAKK